MNETATLIHDADAPPAGAGKFYEVINGQVVEPPEMGAFESLIANALIEAIIFHFAGTGRLGRIFGEVLLRLDPETGLQRRPDAAFVSYERWPRDRRVPPAAAWDVVPDLAIEVVSPGDLALEIQDKLDDYFRTGVRRVWIVLPRSGLVYLYHSRKSVTILDASDELDGGDVLPGFRLRLADLFNGT